MAGVRKKGKSKKLSNGRRMKKERTRVIKDKKMKRLVKINPGKYQKKRKVAQGIPNSVPFKLDIINQAKILKAEELKHELQMKKQVMQNEQAASSEINKNYKSVSDYATGINERVEEYEALQQSQTNSNDEKLTDKSAKAYYKELKKVIQNSDIILQVLDARDPQGTRCKPLEEKVKAMPSKRLVLILNKADLVPRKNLEQWLKFLRKEYPTILFKASTQKQKSNISQINVNPLNEKCLNSSLCVGANQLLQLLKNYCRNRSIEDKVTVGIVGLPNVGKSSLINSLKRSKACSVGAMPGITKNTQVVNLDSQIRLMDCPGLILPGKGASDSASLLRNAVRVDSVEDLVPAVGAIIERIGSMQMMMHYNVPQFKDANEFLALRAKVSGKITVGGVPMIPAAAKEILRDWNTGRIKYFTRAPDMPTETKDVEMEDAESKSEFDLPSLEESDAMVMAELPVMQPTHMMIEGHRPMECIYESDSDDEQDMEEQILNSDDDYEDIDNMSDDEHAVLNNKENKPKKGPAWQTALPEIDINKVSPRMLKKTRKLEAKKRRRSDRKATELTDAMQDMGTGKSANAQQANKRKKK